MTVVKTIWKSVIRPNSVNSEVFEIRVPAKRGARAVSVGLQDGKICVWYEVRPLNEDQDLVLYSVGTGFGKVPDSARFIGTVIEGSYVWHIYAER